MAKNVEYKVLQGLDYPPAKRAEIGDVVSDLPKESISWLLASGVIKLNSLADATPVVADPAPLEVVEEVVADVIEALSNDEPLEKEITDAL
jgi:hypothetical protein